MRNQKEHELQCAFFNWARYHKQLKIAFAIPNGGHRDIRVARKLKAEGVLAGVPDVFIAIPNSKSHGLFIEFKIKPNKQTQSQINFMKQIVALGYDYYVCYNEWADAKEYLENYLTA